VHCFILELRLIVLINQIRVKIHLRKVASCSQHRNNASKSKNQSCKDYEVVSNEMKV